MNFSTSKFCNERERRREGKKRPSRGRSGREPSGIPGVRGGPRSGWRRRRGRAALDPGPRALPRAARPSPPAAPPRLAAAPRRAPPPPGAHTWAARRKVWPAVGAPGSRRSARGCNLELSPRGSARAPSPPFLKKRSPATASPPRPSLRTPTRGGGGGDDDEHRTQARPSQGRARGRRGEERSGAERRREPAARCWRRMSGT